jgi:plasmid stabilization system protein ParE
MKQRYDLIKEVQMDLFEIWRRIAEDSIELAERVEGEFYDRFASLGEMPGQGHTRKDLTKRPFLFFPLYSYLIVYRGDLKPIRIVAVLRGARNVKRILRERL